LNLKVDLLHYEEKLTKECLKVYLEHLRRMKEIKYEIEDLGKEKLA
jgi:hypothetical protein